MLGMLKIHNISKAFKWSDQCSNTFWAGPGHAYLKKRNSTELSRIPVSHAHPGEGQQRIDGVFPKKLSKKPNKQFWERCSSIFSSSIWHKQAFLQPPLPPIRAGVLTTASKGTDKSMPGTPQTCECYGVRWWAEKSIGL